MKNFRGTFVASGFYKRISDFIIDETTFGTNFSKFGDIRSNVTCTDGFNRHDYTNNDPSLFTQLTRQGPVCTFGAKYQL